MINLQIRDSAVLGLLLRFAAALGRAWKGSFLYGLIAADFGGDEAVARSFSAGLVGAPFRWLGRFGAAFPAFGESFFVRICRPEWGVYALVFALPLLPTRFSLALSVFTVAAYLVQLLAGNLKFRVGVIDLFALCFVLLLGRGLVVSYDLAASLPVTAVYVLFTAVYFAARNCIDSRGKLLAFVTIALAAGGLVALYGVWQKFSGALNAEMWLDSTMFEQTAGRVFSTLENPNVLGEYLLFVIPLAAAGVYFYENLFLKFASFGVLAVGGYCMILTYSRGAWLGLILAAAVFAFLNDRRLVWLALAAVFVAPLIVPQSIMERFLSIGDVKDTSTSFRMFIWLASLGMAQFFWPSGIGLGEPTFVLIYQRFSYNAVWAPHSHNLYLHILITLGALGLLTLICLCFSAFRGAMAARNGDRFTKMFAGATIAGLAGFLLQGMTDFVWYNYRATCFFWLILAVCAAVKGMGEEYEKR